MTKIEADLSKGGVEIELQACNICGALTAVRFTVQKPVWSTARAGDPQAHSRYHAERGES